MIYKNFSRYDIDIEKQVVFSNAFNKKRELKMSETPDGYIRCGVMDDKGNRYYRWHQVVFCAFNGITKDEFPTDENGVVYVKLTGACSNCPLIDSTLEDGIEEAIINEIPEVIKVVNED